MREVKPEKASSEWVKSEREVRVIAGAQKLQDLLPQGLVGDNKRRTRKTMKSLRRLTK